MTKNVTAGDVVRGKTVKSLIVLYESPSCSEKIAHISSRLSILSCVS